MPKFSTGKCAQGLIKAAKGVVPDKEISDLLDRIDENQTDSSVADLIEKLTKDYVDRKGYEAFNEKRTALFNAKAKRKMFADMQGIQNTKGVKGKFLTPDKVDEAYTLGSTDPGVGTRNNASSRRDALQHGMAGKLYADLKKQRTDRLTASGKFDLALREASWEITATPEMKAAYKFQALDKLDAVTQKQVRDAMVIWHKTKQSAHAEGANVGVFWHELPGFSISQQHNRQAIRQASGRARPVWDHSKVKDRAAYIKDLLNTLDFDGTAENLRRQGRITQTEAISPEKMAESLWEVFTTGVRKEDIKAGAGSDNVAKTAEMSRVLAFKNPQAEHLYDSKYGNGTFWQGMQNQIRDMAHTINTARFFGPSAEANFNEVLHSRAVIEREKLKGLLPENAPRIPETQGEITNAALPASRQIETPEFKKWFGDSKVVDEEGKPKVVYHGTHKDFTSFDKAKMGSKTGAPSAKNGFFFTDNPTVAESYSHLGSSDRAGILPVYLSLKEPYIHDFKGEAYREQTYYEIIQEAKDDGRDGVILKNTFDDPGIQEDITPEEQLFGSYVERGSGPDVEVRPHTETPHDVYVVFHPEQIKSATGNRGTFDPKNTDITAAATPKGDISSEESAQNLKDVESAIKDSLKAQGVKGIKIEYSEANKSPAWADSREKGKIFINKDVLAEALSRLDENERRPWLERTVAEEVYHVAQHDVERDWRKNGTHAERIGKIYDEISPRDRQSTLEGYNDPRIDPELASNPEDKAARQSLFIKEYTRQLLQRKMNGETTEDVWLNRGKPELIRYIQALYKKLKAYFVSTGDTHVGEYLRAMEGVLQDARNAGHDVGDDIPPSGETSFAATPPRSDPQAKAYERQLAVVEKLNDSSRAKKYFDAYMGTDREPGNMTQGAVVDTLMSWNRLRSLGGSIFASLVNDPYTTAMQNYYAGVPLLRSAFAPLVSIIQRAGKEDVADNIRRMGVGLDGTFGTIASRIDGTNGVAPGGIMRNMENTFFKATGLTGFTDMNKAGYVFTISNEMAEQTGKEFSELTPNMQNHLSDYQIGPQEWEIIRKSGLGEYNGYKMLNSDGVLGAPDEAFGEGSKSAIADKRYDIAAKLTNLFRDSADYASVTPDLKTQQFLKFGAKGTFAGDAARLTLQFQTFNAAMFQKFILRHYRSQSFPTFLFGTIGGLTIAGTFGWYLNQLRKGLNPFANEELWQSDDQGKAAQAWGKILLAGANYSGSGGMMGDWLFNQQSLGGNSGGPAVLGGPTTDAFVAGTQQIGSAVSGNFNAASAMRYGAGLLPGNNIWWARPLLNYGALYGLQENLNPGTLHRLETSAKSNGTPFWAPPSEYAVGGQ